MKMPKLLFVDDDKNVLDDLEEIFGYAGKYEFFSASSGREALGILQKHNIDLVITDLRMPEINGLDLAKHIYKNYPSVKVIFITAVQELIAGAIKVDPIDVIEKPIRSDILLYKVEKYFESKKVQNLLTIGKLIALAGGGVFGLLEALEAAVGINKDYSFSQVLKGLFVITFLVGLVAFLLRFLMSKKKNFT